MDCSQHVQRHAMDLGMCCACDNEVEIIVKTTYFKIFEEKKLHINL
jgi:hypothetical protein